MRHIDGLFSFNTHVSNARRAAHIIDMFILDPIKLAVRSNNNKPLRYLGHCDLAPWWRVENSDVLRSQGPFPPEKAIPSISIDVMKLIVVWMCSSETKSRDRSVICHHCRHDGARSSQKSSIDKIWTKDFLVQIERIWTEKFPVHFLSILKWVMGPFRQHDCETKSAFCPFLVQK